MPKLPANEKDIRLVAKIEEYQKLYSITPEELALAIGRNRATWFARKRNASTFTVSELRKIAAKCHIPMAELTQYI